ncbi:MAG: Asp-tRNA(Asn)/Glu-tRNA(Gln) amidotransferase subunit GatC [Candidatus Binatia bacterium]
MKLTRAEVQRVAVLARLRLSDEAEIQLTAQLEKILSYMETLNRVDTSDVAPFSHATDGANAFREDKAINRPDTEALLANAPDRDATFFKVPKIIE